MKIKNIFVKSIVGVAGFLAFALICNGEPDPTPKPTTPPPKGGTTYVALNIQGMSVQNSLKDCSKILEISISVVAGIEINFKGIEI